MMFVVIMIMIMITTTTNNGDNDDDDDNDSNLFVTKLWPTPFEQGRCQVSAIKQQMNHWRKVLKQQMNHSRKSYKTTDEPLQKML